VIPPTRSAIKTPEQGGCMKIKTRELALIAVIAALYAALVIVLGPTINSGPVQLRLADALIPLSAIFGMPVVIGVSLGAFIGNFYWFISPIDVVLGAVANLAASYIVYRYKERLVLASIVGSFIIGVTVGSYLWLFFPPPSILGLNLPFWLAMIISITLSSLITVSVLGVGLVKALESSVYLEQVR
jgi:uncharacterized membrane protein